jgi:hypothetical protein
VKTGCEFGGQPLGPPLQVPWQRVFHHHCCDRAHDVYQGHVDFGGRQHLLRIGALAKRGIGNGSQTSAFDLMAVFAVELLFHAMHPPPLV